MKKHVFTVTSQESGNTLMELVCRRLEADPRQIEGWVRGGSAYIDGRRELDPGQSLEPGRRVTLFRPEEGANLEETLAVVFQDRVLAVVVKPAGLPCNLTRRGGVESAEQILCQDLGSGATLMHRLDRGASGLMLVSLRGGESRRCLADQISRHRAIRLYLALVAGDPGRDELLLEQPLAMEHGVARPSADPRARPAMTQVRLLRRLGDQSLVQAEPRTGRTHQIRAHLAAAGLPIMGDERYGGPEARRLKLHAHGMRFRHPDGQMVELHSPLPGGFIDSVSLS